MAAMAFQVEWNDGTLRIELSRWDRMGNFGRRAVWIDRANVVNAGVVPRGELEIKIDHRQLGIGPHFGWRWPGRRRVGTMLGRAVVGKQFWAVARSGPELPLLVLDLVDHEFVRVVIDASDSEAIAASIGSDSSPERDI